jgi:DNA-binding XRE family transcriptional regulator
MALSIRSNIAARVYTRTGGRVVSEAATFWRLVDVLDMRSCWRWKGTEQGNYGSFSFGGNQIQAHRFSWAFAYGPIPAGALVLHSCDNTWCVNPRHLRVGTHEDNNADKSVLSRVLGSIAEADRAAIRVGRGAPIAPQTEALPIHARIRQFRTTRGMSQADLAAACDTVKSCVSHWERGISLPTGKRIPVVAAALGVTVAELFGGEP